MNEAFDRWVEAGYKNLSEALGDNKTNKRKKSLVQQHPEFEKLQQVKKSKRQAKREKPQ